MHSIRQRPQTRLAVESLEERRLLASGYLLTNLVSDQANSALLTDAQLINPWGIALGSSGDFWVSDNGSGVATLYGGDAGGSPFQRSSLVVTVPDGAPTGQVFNGTGNFNVANGTANGSALFILASENGFVDGWSAAVPPSTLARQGVARTGAVYKGIALANNGTADFLYVANFNAGTIDVFDQTFHAATLTGSFTDANLPAGFAPFNVQGFGGKLFVAYAKQDSAKHDDVPGAGNGYVDVFDTNGNLLQRLIIGGDPSSPLNSPWGMAMAPANFGDLAGDLLVGNFGDGKINAFNPVTGAFAGALDDANGNPVVIDGLWGLTFGNGATAGDANKLYFAAGPGGETHGLFGSIQSAQGAALAATSTALSLFQRVSFSGTVAAFSSALPHAQTADFAASIVWGDGATTTGTITATGNGSFLVTGAHAYAVAGSEAITVTITDKNNQRATAFTTANVSQPSLNATGLGVNGVEFTPVTNSTLATFTDSSNEPASALSATIEWGDHTTSTGTVMLAGTTYSVQGSHTYQDEGNYTITLTISDASVSTNITMTGKIVEELLPDNTRGTPNQRYLSELYRDLLGRRIDANGLSAWGALLTQDSERPVIVRGIEGSDEFRQNEVSALYKLYLHRSPDTAGLQAGVGFLRAGGTVEQIAAALAASNEYYQKGGGTDGGWVDGLYQDTLQRAVDAPSKTAILNALKSGTTRAQIATAVLASREYHLLLVQRFYQRTLDRSPDAAGSNLFAGLLDQGMRDEDLLVDLASSDEYFGKTA